MSESSTLAPEVKYRVLLEISQKISRTLNLQDVLNHLLDSARSVVAYDAAGIFVLSRSAPSAQSTGPFVIAGMAKVGFPEKPDEHDPMYRYGKGIIGHVIRSGQTVIVPDVRLDELYEAGRKSTLSEITVPIVSNEQVIGALDLESDRVGAFTEADAELLNFFASAAAMSIEKARLHQEVLEKQRIEQQLVTARDVQAGLLPAIPPEVPGYDVAAIHEPTWAIGGDYYDYISLGDGRLGLVIADVSGKGVPAALIMATFRAVLRTELRKRTEIRDLIENVNRDLLESSDDAQYVTAVYGILEPANGRFTYVNCGHNPPIMILPDGETQVLDHGGPALGLFDGRRFESAAVTLSPGGTMALYTDGVVEPAQPDGAEFGRANLERVLRDCDEASAGETVRSVVEATRDHSGRDSYDDDFTLVIVKRL
jgi:serine phosphatase RsbU (regulator of sigma subunit)